MLILNDFPAFNGVFVTESRRVTVIRRFKSRKSASRVAKKAADLFPLDASVVDLREVMPEFLIPFYGERPYAVRVYEF